MSFKKRVIPALIASAMLVGTPAANAVTFSGVFVFGDSLSDSGFFRPFLVGVGTPAATAAGLGRFTTNPGPVWSELIAQTYGGNGAPSNAGGGIYAQGGARAQGDSASTPPGFAQRPIGTQIGEYLTRAGGSADPGALYAVWAGANDIFQNFAGIAGGTVNPTTVINTAAGTEIAQIARLRGAGARYIMVFNLPDLGSTPSFAPTAIGAAGSAAATSLSLGYNATLFAGLIGTKVIPVDAFALFNDVKANAAAFGFTNTTGMACNATPPVGLIACGPGNLVATGAATSYLFADGVHPTTGSQAIVADFVKSLIDGPNTYSTMTEVPLASRAAHIRTLDEGLQSGQSAAVGKIVAFAAGDGGKFDISRNNLSPQSNTKNRAGSAGVSMRASDVLTVGVAVGASTADTSLGSAGKFDLDETAFSLFASLRSDGLYGNFMATSSDLKFRNVQRTVKLGSLTRVASSSTNGSNVSMSLTAGYDFKFNTVSVGPFASYTSQLVDVSAFTESGSGSADLNIFQQNRKSRVSSFGVRASVALGNWTPYARVSVDKENENSDRFVSANPVSVAAGLSYDIPGYKGDDTWVTGTIGVRGKLT
ncbi:MAG: autotransporter domain-containing protein, partial [Burkholderiales bacterium]|nr:autotransporter domain-containing protein [Burkholderiales bacterium]